jgi:hypothetical protein
MPDAQQRTDRLIEKLERTLALVVLLHAHVTDLLLTLSGERESTVEPCR